MNINDTGTITSLPKRFPLSQSEWSFTICFTSCIRGARCSSAVRAMGRRIVPSWWTRSAISHSRQCSKTGVTKAMVCAILSVG